MGSPRRVPNKRRRTRQSPEPACVQTTSSDGVAHARRKVELTFCPWYRLVGVARAARKGKWSPRGTGTTVLTYPCRSQPCSGGSKGCARVTGKAGEKPKSSGRAAAHPEQDRRLPGVVTHPRPQRGTARSRVGTRATSLWGRYRLGHPLVVLLCYQCGETAQCTQSGLHKGDKGPA